MWNRIVERLSPPSQQSKDSSNGVSVGAVIVVLIVIVAALYAYSVVHPRVSATPTPSGSYAARAIPINQLTGADLLTMSFTERQHFVTAATQGIHCPSGVNDNDLAIGVTRAANTAGGASQKATQLLAALLALDGCVAG